MVDFTCSSVQWRGSIFPTNEPSFGDDYSYGTLRHCITVTRKGDSNPSYNFYEVRMTDEWGVTNNGGWQDNHAYGHIAVSPSAIDFMATPTVISDHTCFNALSFGFSFMGFGVEINPEICRDTKITRTSQSGGIVFWDTPNVLKTPMWDEVDFVKVPQSAHPTFTAAMHYPWYTRTYNTTCMCWKNGEVQKLTSVSVNT